MQNDTIMQLLTQPEAMQNALQALKECLSGGTGSSTPSVPTTRPTPLCHCTAMEEAAQPSSPIASTWETRKETLLLALKDAISAQQGAQIDHAMELCELAQSLKNMLTTFEC